MAVGREGHREDLAAPAGDEEHIGAPALVRCRLLDLTEMRATVTPVDLRQQQGNQKHHASFDPGRSCLRAEFTADSYVFPIRVANSPFRYSEAPHVAYSTLTLLMAANRRLYLSPSSKTSVRRQHPWDFVRRDEIDKSRVISPPGAMHGRG